MRFRILLAKLVILAVASMLVSGSVVFAGERAASVDLRSQSTTGGVTGTISVVSVTGPTGGTTLAVAVDNTIAGDIYALNLGRQGSTFRVTSLVTYVTGGVGTVTIQVQMDKAPTNGQSFQLVNMSTTSQDVSISDPIRY